jgi:hypothetical protein
MRMRLFSGGGAWKGCRWWGWGFVGAVPGSEAGTRRLLYNVDQDKRRTDNIESTRSDLGI